MPTRKGTKKKRTTRPRKAAMVPHVVPREPPPVMLEDDERGRRGVYVRAPVSSETAAALENLFNVAGSLFRAVGDTLTALERETPSRRPRRRG